MKALVFGEILWDIIEGVPHLGGAPLNYAAHLTQCGNHATIVSAVGNDELGERALDLVAKMGVDTSLVQQVEKPTGYVPVTLKNGQPDYEITRNVAYDYIDWGVLSEHNLKEFDVFYFGSIIQRNSMSAESLYNLLDRFEFANVFYDVNFRRDSYTREVVLKSTQNCTTLKVNDEEVYEIGKLLFDGVSGFEEFCGRITERFRQISTIIITAGKDGCWIHDGSTLTNVPTDQITVVDTVGAGDSFSAAFTSCYARTQDPIEAARIANIVGGFVASSHGPIPTYSPEIRKLINS